MATPSSKRQRVIVILVGAAFFCLSPLSQAQIANEDIIIGKHKKLYSEILNEERSLFIHLPQDYDKSEEKYPVLYVLDGGYLPTFSSVTGTVEFLVWGNIPSLIIVGLKNTDRERDMFPMRTESDPTSGGADHFLSFFSEELIPFVDKNYRTENFRLLSGTSNSAFFTVYALLKKPDLFSAYIASSPTLLSWFDGLMNEKLGGLKKENESLNKFLYLIYGENDYPSIIKSIPGFAKLLEENAPKGLVWEIELIEDDGHVPYNSLHKGLQFVFAGWRFPREKLPETTFQEVKAYYDQLTEKYGFRVRIPIMVLLNLGNDMVKKNRVDEALEVLEYSAKLHPGDPNAHLYLGLAYEQKGEKARALKHIEKALEIDPTWERAKRKLAELGKK